MRVRTGSLLCLGLLLSACGASGGSGTVQTPPTGVTPTPTPTPTPTGGALKPNAGTQSVASVQYLTVNAAGTMTSDRSVVAPPTQFSIAYNASSRIFTVQNELRTRQFGPSQLDTETSVPDYYPRVEYSSRAAGEVDYLVLFKQSNSTPAIPLSYSAYGAWQHNLPQVADTRIRLDYFIYGTPTPDASMPHTGVITYRWAGTGNYADNSRLYFTSSAGSLRVDFAAGTVTGTVTLTGGDLFTGGAGGLLSFTVSGTITGNAASGTLGFSFPTWAGTFKGQFYGPQAEEVGVSYAATSADATFNGAFVGTRL